MQNRSDEDGPQAVSRPIHRRGLRHMRGLVVKTVVAASSIGLAAACWGGPAQAATAGDVATGAAGPGQGAGFQFSAEPYSAPGAEPRSQFSYDLQAGHKLVDQLVVVNTSHAAETFILYGEDATNVPGTGQYAFQQRSQMHNTGVGAWLTPGTPRVTVPAGKEVLLAFQLGVPNDALPGDHVGGIAVEEVKSPPQQSEPVGLNLVLRVVVPVYVHVVGPSNPGLTVEGLTVFHQSPPFPYIDRTKVAVRLVLVNTGNEILHPETVTVTIRGQLSGTIHRYVVHQSGAGQSVANPLPVQMLPGATVVLTEVWNGIPPFDPLSTEVSADATDISSTQQVSTTASTSFWYFPWILVLLVLLLIAALVVIRWRRRRRNRPPSGPAGDHGDGSRSRVEEPELEQAGA